MGRALRAQWHHPGGRLSTFEPFESMSVTRKQSPPFDRNYQRPKLRLPPGACDTHFHIFGPQSRFPLIPGHIFSDTDFGDATLDDWVAMQDALGLTRGLHIQTQMYGHGYELMLHAQCRFPDRLRAVVIPAPDITDRELTVLTDAGVVGARFTYRMFERIDERMVARTAERGWSMHYLPAPGEAGREWHARVLATPGKFVLEHAGNPDPARGLDDPNFKFTLQCLDTGRCWVKMSPRFSAQPVLPFSDTDPFHHKLVAHAPERLLWGSDWPHPIYYDPMPNDADLLDIMQRWVPDEAVRRRIFVDNPTEAFSFPVPEPAGAGT